MASILWCAPVAKASDAGATNGLKSAYLGGSVWSENLSSRQINDQVRAHFAEVVVRLEAHTATGLLTALRRAEATAVQPWTKAQRQAALIYLVDNRQQQINRIRDYMNRGRFPLNEGQSPDVVPVFVDRHHTRCAVAHLMHSDGKDMDVASVVNANNLVRVGDVRGGKMAEWIRSSGLTHEEVAMVQPAYPLDFDASFETLQTQSLQKNGISISNMRVLGTRFNFDLPENIAANPQVLHEALAFGKIQLESANLVGSSFRNTHGVIVNENPGLFRLDDFIATPDNLESWVFFGPDDGVFSGLVGTSRSTGNVGLVSIEYTLEAEAGVIDKFALTATESTYSPHNSASGEQAAIMLLSEILDPSTNTLIDTLSLSTFGAPQGSSELLGSDVAAVGRKSVRLNNYAIGLAGGNDNSYIHSFFQEFSILAVPEPGSSAILILILGTLALRRVRSKSSLRC